MSDLAARVDRWKCAAYERADRRLSKIDPWRWSNTIGGYHQTDGDLPFRDLKRLVAMDYRRQQRNRRLALAKAFLREIPRLWDRGVDDGTER